MKSPFRLTNLTPVIVLFALAAFALGQAKNFPPPTGNINDFANIIDPTTKQQLETLLLNFRKKTGTKIVVATIPSLNDRSIEDYALDLYRAWGISEKSGENRDKGALLLVALQDRKMRLETGYGLEADLPDGLAGEIVHRMQPYFRQQQYSEGIKVAVRTLVDTLAAKWNVSIEGVEDRQFAYGGRQSPELGGKGLSVLIVAFIGFIILMMIIGKFSRRRSSSVGGLGGSLWWLAPLIFNRGGGGFSGGSWSSSDGSGGDSGGGWGGGDSGGGDMGGFGGGESGGGGASDSW